MAGLLRYFDKPTETTVKVAAANMSTSLTPDQLKAMEKHALLNAVQHAGKAEAGAVMSKTLGESPSLRAMAKEVGKAAAEVVKRVNSLSPPEQQKLLEERYPEAIEASE